MNTTRIAAALIVGFLLLIVLRLGGLGVSSKPVSPDQVGASLEPTGPAIAPSASSPAPGDASLTPSSGDPILVGAGNIADCKRTEDEATAALIAGLDGTVFTLGDNAYENGSPEEYAACYGSSWGQFRDRTRPTPGNHDYTTPGAPGYFGYFSQGSTSLAEYYAYDLGDWRIYAINSEIDVGAKSAEVVWLRKDLAANPHRCVLAYWHQPRFSSGLGVIGSRLDPLWQTLIDAGADVIVNGHHHMYERFAPQTLTGGADAESGIREFIVGTGGKALHELGEVAPNSEVRDNTTYGVLKLTLHPRSYDWQFVAIPGSSFEDSGTASCH